MKAPAPMAEQLSRDAQIERLREHGFVVMPGFVPTDALHEASTRFLGNN